MNILSAIRLALKYGPELESILQAHRAELERQAWEADRHRLRLCHRHRQEANHSHYAEKNCDYCRLLKTLHNGSKGERE